MQRFILVAVALLTAGSACAQVIRKPASTPAGITVTDPDGIAICDAASCSAGDELTYDSANGCWDCCTGGGCGELVPCTDVTCAAGDLLAWNDTDSCWSCTAAAQGPLLCPDSTCSDGDELLFDGAQGCWDCCTGGGCGDLVPCAPASGCDSGGVMVWDPDNTCWNCQAESVDTSVFVRKDAMDRLALTSSWELSFPAATSPYNNTYFGLGHSPYAAAYCVTNWCESYTAGLNFSSKLNGATVVSPADDEQPDGGSGGTGSQHTLTGFARFFANGTGDAAIFNHGSATGSDIKIGGRNANVIFPLNGDQGDGNIYIGGTLNRTMGWSRGGIDKTLGIYLADGWYTAAGTNTDEAQLILGNKPDNTIGRASTNTAVRGAYIALEGNDYGVGSIGGDVWIVAGGSGSGEITLQTERQGTGIEFLARQGAAAWSSIDINADVLLDTAGSVGVYDMRIESGGDVLIESNMIAIGDEAVAHTNATCLTRDTGRDWFYVDKDCDKVQDAGEPVVGGHDGTHWERFTGIQAYDHVNSGTLPDLRTYTGSNVAFKAVAFESINEKLTFAIRAPEDMCTVSTVCYWQAHATLVGDVDGDVSAGDVVMDIDYVWIADGQSYDVAPTNVTVTQAIAANNATTLEQIAWAEKDQTEGNPGEILFITLYRDTVDPNDTYPSTAGSEVSLVEFSVSFETGGR